MTPDSPLEEDGDVPLHLEALDAIIREDHGRLRVIEQEQREIKQALLGYAGDPGMFAMVRDHGGRIRQLEDDKQRLLGAAVMIGLAWTVVTVALTIWAARAHA